MSVGMCTFAYTTVETGASLANLDAFIDAKYAALANRGQITSWIVRPDVANAISKLKTASSSNEYLVAFDSNGEMTIAGVPVLVSDQVDANTKFWGISKSRSVLVIRKGIAVERSTESAFRNYALDLLSNFRYGLGFLHEAANVRGYDAA